MISIIKEFEIKVQEHPDKLLYSFLDIKGNVKESYTYKEFFDRVKSISSHLYATGALKPGDKALLVYPPGLEMICAFFACVKLGAIPVPVYPPSAKGFHASAQIMSFIARNCGAVAILSDRSYYWSIKVNLIRKNKAPFFKESECFSNCSCANSLEVYFLVSNSNTVDGVVFKGVGVVTKLLPPVKEEVILVVSVATVVGVYSFLVKLIPESLGTFIEVGVKGTDCKLTSVTDANPAVAVRVCGVNALEVYDLVPVG